MTVKNGALPRKSRRMSIDRRRSLEAYIFLIPWIIGVCVFFAYPISVSVRLAFSKITSFKGLLTEWVGLENFQYIFFYDINFVPTFLKVVADTLINTPLCMVFSLLIAILINRKMVGRGFFRTAFFIPVLLGTGYIMKQILGMGDDSTTIATGIMVPKLIAELLGVSITEVVQSFLDRITLVLWKSGVQIVLFLAGLQGISGSLYEAARVDGATEWEMFWKITLPMITPIIMMNLVYTIVAFFTDGTNPMVDYIFKVNFTNQQYEYGAAMSWIYFFFAGIFCLLAILLMRGHMYDSGAKA